LDGGGWVSRRDDEKKLQKRPRSRYKRTGRGTYPMSRKVARTILE